MPIAAALVCVNEKENNKVDFLAHRIKTVDDIENEIIDQGQISLEANGQGDHMFYVWLKKESISFYEYWTLVGNASKYDANWEPVAQYGVWACMYQIEIPKFNRKMASTSDFNKQNELDFAKRIYKDTISDRRTIYNNSLYDDEMYEGIFLPNNKKHKNKKSKRLDLTKDFNLFGCSVKGSKKNIIEFPKVQKKKLRTCLVELTRIALSDTKSRLFEGCPVIKWDAIDSAKDIDYNYSCYE